MVMMSKRIARYRTAGMRATQRVLAAIDVEQSFGQHDFDYTFGGVDADADVLRERNENLGAVGRCDFEDRRACDRFTDTLNVFHDAQFAATALYDFAANQI